MFDRLTAAQLGKWRALAEAATDGPWSIDTVKCAGDVDFCVDTATNIGRLAGNIERLADASFIAESRTIVPALLDEWRAMQKEIADGLHEIAGLREQLLAEVTTRQEVEAERDEAIAEKNVHKTASVYWWIEWHHAFGKERPEASVDAMEEAAQAIEKLRNDNRALASGEHLREMAEATKLVLNEMDAPNYVEVVLARDDDEQPSLIMTLQKAEGETPHQLRKKAEDELGEAHDEEARLRLLMRVFRDKYGDRADIEFSPEFLGATNHVHVPDGTPGVRDQAAPCKLFQPGKPSMHGSCDGDGHYLCAECTELKSDEEST